jgi:DNA repair photolyase
VRWDNLRAEGEAPGSPAALPLKLPGAVVRTFDTPGFAGMTFYEVRAKSLINRVPSVSRVPFDWTINPYRGCSHACVYCLGGDTPILMADGRTRPLAEIRVGDRIYGTVRHGKRRRYAITRVLAHWSTVRGAHRVTLADGTQLITGADHRFLTDQGWKFVTGSGRRAQLREGSRMVGTGRFADPPKDSPEYRRGYLCGLLACGAANLLRLHDEARQRAGQYLHDIDADALAGVLRWPQQPDADMCRGWLASVFDARGRQNGGVLRLAATDPEFVERILACLRQLGFDGVADSRSDGRGGLGRVGYVRLRGGLPERLRFFHTVDPAATGRRQITHEVAHADDRLRVVSVEALGIDLPLYDITTGTGDFIADGVVSHNCYARNTHSYLDLDTGHDFDSRVVVKVNAGEVLRRELAAPKWTGAPVAMGTNVDCYQRAEGRYRLMREILAALRDHANPFSILTKGTLILRDLDLLRQAASVAEVRLSLSVGFVDETLWRSVEPGTPSPARRLDAVRQLTDAGFAVGVMMAPVLPGITDSDAQLDATVAAIAAAGATSVVPIALHLRPGAREWFIAWLTRERPDLVQRYRQLYGQRSYLPDAVQRELSARVRLAAARHGIGASNGYSAREMSTVEKRAEQLELPITMPIASGSR